VKTFNYAALILAFTAIYALTLAVAYSPQWVLVVVSASLTYGSLGVLVAVRRLYFLAASTPHAALLAVTLSIPLAKVIGGSSYFYAALLGLALVYVAGYMIHRGIDPDIATSVLTGASSALSVLAIAYVSSRYPLEYSLASVIVGDPLLVGWREAVAVAGLALVCALTVYLTYTEQLSIGVDRDSALLSGIRVWVYDLLAYTLIGIGAVALIRVVGFILEHVLILLPPAIATATARSAREALTLTLAVSTASSIAGLHFSIALNQPPSGVIGAILITLYALSIVWGGRK